MEAAFAPATAEDTTWTAPTGAANAQVATLTLAVTDGSFTVSQSVQVTVRAPVPDLALPALADQTGATGDIVNLQIASATDGRAPYSYAFSGLPEELGAIGRRIRGLLITPGTETVSVTVTDANGDTATQTFDWTVTGTAILPPSGINVRIDWGDAFFTNANANVTGRIVSDIRCQRGRTTGSAIQGRTAAGRMTFELQNSDGLYDQEGMSDLAGLIRPGIIVQLQGRCGNRYGRAF